MMGKRVVWVESRASHGATGASYMVILKLLQGPCGHIPIAEYGLGFMEDGSLRFRASVATDR
jgi:hypothetical protein